MIRKLRIKLIAAAMCALAVVLVLIMLVIGLFDYRKVVEDADDTLSLLTEGGGVFPSMDSYLSATIYSGRSRTKVMLSLELPYESRYFTVLYDSRGNLLACDTSQIASVDAAQAVVYAQEVMEKGRSAGFLSDYRYAVNALDWGTQVIFLDCTRSMSTFRTFLTTGLLVCVAGLAAVGAVLSLLSARIVKPFAENYEKQKRFITDAGHELKTPMTIIDADAEILEMDYGQSEWLDDIKYQIGRLTGLTGDLIQLSRLEEENASLNFIELPLSDLVEETVQSFAAPAQTKNQTVTAQIQPMISLVGDEKGLRQLVSILMDNALKYAPDGSEILITLERQRSQVHLSVLNPAESVSKEDLTRLFDRFYRTDQSRSSRTGGYGLGLSIASAIVTAHRGKITASSEDGKSLRITVILPCGTKQDSHGKGQEKAEE